jgi:hypothetical protein
MLKHGLDFEEGFVVGAELGALFDLAKSCLKDGETVPGFQHVDEILDFDAARGEGNLVSMEPRFRLARPKRSPTSREVRQILTEGAQSRRIN